MIGFNLEYGGNLGCDADVCLPALEKQELLVMGRLERGHTLRAIMRLSCSIRMGIISNACIGSRCG